VCGRGNGTLYVISDICKCVIERAVHCILYVTLDIYKCVMEGTVPCMLYQVSVSV